MCSGNTLDMIKREMCNEARVIFGEKLQSIFLYGSYARGDFNDESDIDIMIIADINQDELIEAKKILSNYMFEQNLKHDVVLSIILQDKDFFDKWRDDLPFFRNVIREGVDLVA